MINALGNKSLKSYSSSDGAKFRDWLLDNNMSINTILALYFYCLEVQESENQMIAELHSL